MWRAEVGFKEKPLEEDAKQAAIQRLFSLTGPSLPFRSTADCADYRTLTEPRPGCRLLNTASAATINLCYPLLATVDSLIRTLSPQGLRCVWEGWGAGRGERNAEGGHPTRLMNMKRGEKMEGWLQLEHWGLLPETGNQERWQDQRNSIKGAVPRAGALSQTLVPAPSNQNQGAGRQPQ